MSKDIHILQTGVANIASVIAAFKRQGVAPILTDDPNCVSTADRVVIPGVGAFGAGMSKLRETGLDRPIKLRTAQNLPTLAVCLGLQLLADSSEETPGVHGLGILHGQVKRFPTTLRVPHFGWNEIVPGPGSRFLVPGFAYFANSYRLLSVSAPWIGSICSYGEPFIAAVEHGNLLGCQFHPELSGKWGADLLARWIESC